MKKKIVFALVFLSSLSALAYNAKALGGWPFTAPKVTDKDGTFDTGYFQEGDIVYDESEDKYYGMKNGGAWTELGGSAPSNFVSTSDTREWGDESVYITNSGTPTVSLQSGWVNSLTDNGTGDTTINIKAGTFSSAPICTCSPEETGVSTLICVINAATTTSAARIRVSNSSGTAVDRNFHAICNGPR